MEEGRPVSIFGHPNSFEIGGVPGSGGGTVVCCLGPPGNSLDVVEGSAKGLKLW